VDASASFTIGVKAYCTDGLCGHLTQVVLDPIDDTVTDLIVEPEHRQGLGRLVPVAWATPQADRVDLRCTREEFDRLEVAEAVRFLPGVVGYMGFAPENLLLWPYFGSAGEVPVVFDTLPKGEVAVRRGEEVRATDGKIGVVEGLVIDEASRRVSHIVLKEGHLFGHKDVAIPITAVDTVGEDGITLNIGKRDVEGLPDVKFHRPAR